MSWLVVRIFCMLLMFVFGALTWMYARGMFKAAHEGSINFAAFCFFVTLAGLRVTLFMWDGAMYYGAILPHQP